MTLGTKLVTSFLGCGLIPLGVVAFVSYSTARKGMDTIQTKGSADLEHKVYNELIAMRDVKKEQIKTYFGVHEGDIGVLVDTVGTLRKEAVTKLVALREVKKKQVESYFSERQGDMGVLVDTVGTLRAEAFNKLSAIQAVKKGQVLDYVEGLRGQLHILKDDPYAQQALVEFVEAFEAGGDSADSPEWEAVATKYDGRMKGIMEDNGWYDLFLIHTDGDIVYTATRESDLGMTIPDSVLKDSSLGEAFAKAQKADAEEISFGDMAPYSPSAGAPAAFMVGQMRNGEGTLVGYAALQFPLDKINEIMLVRNGMGETGESYLVGQDGLMRSDSFLDPEGHSVVAAFKNNAKVDTEGIRDALSGGDNQNVILDYNNNPVLSCWNSIDLGSGVRWAMLSEMDVAEAFCPKDAQGEYFFKKYIEKCGYYDLFLMNPDGYCFYTVAQEADYQTNFVDGKYKDTNLGSLTRKVLKTHQFGFADFKPYAPNNDEPAAFIAQPVTHGGETEIVVALQMPLDAINNIMGVRDGMGETGETFLVGPDKLMRSDSFLDPTNHTVKASFANPSKGSVDTEAANRALAGITEAKVIIDYGGNPVLSAYTPIDVFGTTWGLLAEIDVAEAFCPKDDAGTYFFKKYTDQYGYHDLFLMNPDGYCFYTVAKESDYQTNFVNGKFASSNLGELTREVLANKRFGFADFKPYEPSNGTPAAFIAQPFVQDGETEMVIALQLPLDAINGIMGVRAGMGATGETYLVGPDKLMRSDSFLDAANHTVAASFANPSKGSVDTEAATAALRGETDAKIITGYNGNPVLSAYTPVDVFGTQWAILAEIDESEAMAAAVDMKVTGAAAANKLLTWVGTLGVIAAIIVAVVSVLIARSISKPVGRIIVSLNEGADQVNDAASQVASASQQLAEGASEQASSLEETSSALEEMSAMTRTNAENAKEANSLSAQARSAAEGGDRTMGQLNSAMTDINESSGQISKIIKVIEEIAFQTNLLALNAAVEAARAGEHGKGFAVVADEVRNLAQRAAQASREITGLIENSVEKAKQGTEVANEVGKALGAIVGDVTKVTGLIDGISKASEEQAQGVDQVNTAVSQMDKVTQQNASGAEESASASEELSAQAQSVKSVVDELAVLISGNSVGNNGAVVRKPSQSAPKGKVHPAIHHVAPKPVGAATAASGGPSSSDEFMNLDDKKNLSDF